MIGQVTHFEIYGDDPATLAKFYAGLFGWKLERAPGIDYWRIQTEPKSSSGFDGGLTFRPSDGPSSWLHYVTVASVDKALEQAQRSGARIVRPKTAVPRTGWYAVLADPQGNTFGIWQADAIAFPEPEPD
jgi:predicted enzyme related to lactoylglutathione lyase